MSLAEHVVVLAGTWVHSRKRVGRGEVLVCECPPALNKDAVRAEIGDVTPFHITQVKNGVSKLMNALRIGHNLIVWEDTSITEGMEK